MPSTLPAAFADLEPFTEWCLATEAERYSTQAVNAYACTIQIPAIDEYINKVVTAGGTIALPKMPIPGIGWLAYFKDTEGNIVGVMQPDPQAK